MRSILISGVIGSIMAISALAIGATPAATSPKAPAPVAAKADDVRVIATCKDGTEWRARSEAHQGACARHGGVATWKDGSAVRARGAALNPVKPKAPAK